MSCFVGVDVGTGSARAGVFDADGRLRGQAASPITTYRPRPGFAQQSAAQIWGAVAAAVRGAVSAAGVAPADISGIGFDATCSLVVTGAQGAAVSVCPDDSAGQDVILWMDHRALGDAAAINAIGGPPLAYVGGAISPEMELPKLRWLKREKPAAWAQAAACFDLPDWLVQRATGTDIRSLCSLVCKWTYLGHKGLQGEGWDDAFLHAIGLGDLAQDNHSRIGARLAAPGQYCGGITDAAAQELGLLAGTPVAASMIDAHAGALGTLGVGLGAGAALDGRLALIAGTSTCHITLTPKPVFVPGIWGPYFGVVTDRLWALEGGQSAAGALLDSVVAGHAASAALERQAQAQGCRVTDLIAAHLAGMADETATLTQDRHLQPDVHGNRSPRAEPWRKGGMAGLTLDSGLDDLALAYLAAVQALAYGTRHILQVMRDHGVPVDTLVVSGGLARNTLFLREHADATGCNVIVPDQPEPVLLGCAMLGAVAAGAQPDLPAAMARMSGAGVVIAPRGGAIAAYHDRKYRVMQRMQDDYADYAALMKGTTP